MATTIESSPLSREPTAPTRRRAVLLVAPAPDWPTGALLHAEDFAEQLTADLWLLELHPRHAQAAEPGEGRAWVERTLRTPFPLSRVFVRHERLEHAVAHVLRSVTVDVLVVPPELRASATKLAGRLGIPVLVAHADSPSQAILAATDLSDSHFPVVQFGADLSARLGKPLVIFHNVEPSVATIPPGFYPAVEVLPPPEGLVAARREVLGRLAHEFIPAPQAIVETRETAAEAVLAAARSLGADLIVVGAHRHTWLGRLVLNSTAREVVERSPHSVMVVPMPRAHAA